MCVYGYYILTLQATDAAYSFEAHVYKYYPYAWGPEILLVEQWGLHACNLSMATVCHTTPIEFWISSLGL